MRDLTCELNLRIAYGNPNAIPTVTSALGGSASLNILHSALSGEPGINQRCLGGWQAAGLLSADQRLLSDVLSSSGPDVLHPMGCRPKR